MESNIGHEDYLDKIRKTLEDDPKKNGSIEDPTAQGFLAIIRLGKSAWNSWRIEFPSIPIELKGTTFAKSECDFSDFIFNTESSQHIDFSDCHFEGPVNFDRARIGGSVTFSKSTFHFSCSFKSTEFKISPKIFDDTEAIKSEAEIKKPSFPSSESQGIDFSQCIFDKEAIFIRSVFGEKVVFSGAKFHANCDFFHILFEKDMVATSVLQELTCVEKRISIEHTSFNSNADFCGAKINECNFHKVKFSTANFDECFLSKSKFSNCEFHGAASFVGSSFLDDIDFTECEFNMPLSFEGKKEKGNSFERISFQGTFFHRSVKFTNREFKKTTSFSSSRIESIEGPKLRISKVIVKFCGRLTSSLERLEKLATNALRPITRLGAITRRLKKSPAFPIFDIDKNYHENSLDDLYLNAQPNNFRISEKLKKITTALIWLIEPRWIIRPTTFHSIIEFHGSKIHHDTSLDDVLFLAPPSPEAARAYRTLKLAMEQLKATREEQKFFRLEMIAEHSSLSRGKRCISNLYRFFSNYGFSLWRPFTALAVLSLLFGGGYELLAKKCASDPVCDDAATAAKATSSEDRTWNLLKYTLASAAPVPGLDKMQTDLRAPLFGQNGWIVATAVVLEIFHKILALVMTFLFALALRNLFKMKS